MNAVNSGNGGAGMSPPNSTARMVGKMGLGAAALGMAALGMGIWGPAPAAHADITGTTPFGSNIGNISVSSSSGYLGQDTNGTMTFNAQGISGLSATNLPPEVSSGWYAPTIPTTTSTLRLTYQAFGDDSSAWFNAPQNVAAPWTTSFTWNNINLSNGPAGGFGFFFALQNTTKGLSYVGGEGPNMGLTTNAVMSSTQGGVLSTADIPTNTIGIGINNTSGTYRNDNNGLISTNGMLQVVYGSTILNVPVTGGVDFLGTEAAGGSSAVPAAPVNFTLSYNGANSILLTAIQGGNTFSDTIALPGTLAGIVGGNTAYVGFTATTGDQMFGPTQGLAITNFSYVPEPGVLGLLSAGGLGLLVAKRRKMA